MQGNQVGRGHWDLYYTSPQSFIITVYYLLAYQYGDFYLISICQFIKLSVQTFQPLIVIYRRGNFVFLHWGHTSIYQPLSWLTTACVCKYFDDAFGIKTVLSWYKSNRMSNCVCLSFGEGSCQPLNLHRSLEGL